MKKTIIILVIAVGAIGAVAFTLINNKTEMAENVTAAMKTADFVPVTVEKVRTMALDQNFESNGVFQAHQEVTLMSETSGAIVNILKKKGDFVRKGDLILEIDDRLIRSELTIAALENERATKDQQRFANLVASNAITQKQFEDSERALKISDAQLQAIRKRAEDTKIKAPIAGYINDDFYEPGVLVSPGMPLANIINKNPLKLVVHISENEVATAKVGDILPVKVNAIPNKTFEGKIDFIADKADGAFKYEVILIVNGENAEMIKPGMFGTAAFASTSTGSSLVINRKSLSGGLKNPGVFIIEDEKAVYKPIVVRPLNASLVEVIEGLQEGEEIITSGLINVKEGIKVKVQ